MSNNLITKAGVEGSEITNPVLGNLGQLSGVDFIKQAIPALIGYGFLIGAIIFFFMILVGSIRWISSAGDKGALESARGTITNAVVGLVILFSLFAILDLIHIFFNVTIMTLDIGPLVIR
jgi:hypothetical protein